jgi:hypothetical protein
MVMVRVRVRVRVSDRVRVSVRVRVRVSLTVRVGNKIWKQDLELTQNLVLTWYAVSSSIITTFCIVLTIQIVAITT